VTQALVMRLAVSAGIAWQQQPITVDEVRHADEVLLLGTTTGIWQGRIVGAAAAAASLPEGPSAAGRGRVCTALQQAYAHAVT
jgi:branched-subunit amino acid aminotransferase/4-amino-4-deoxychorismate lyase